MLIIGIGNPMRGDDGAGWAVIDKLEKQVTVEMLCKQKGDISELLDLFARHSTVYIIDASLSNAPPGSWQRIDALRQSLPIESNQTSTHGFNISQVIALAKNLNQLPIKLIIYAIAAECYDMSETLSPPVEKAVEEVSIAILNEKCMHEKSLMDDLIRKILLLAEEQKASKITKVYVKLGALSHMSKEHFKEHFTISAKGTLAQNAEIEAEESQDINDPNAMVILLKSIDIEE